MTILQKAPKSGNRRSAKGWHKFGHADDAVRHTDAWEHETFAEEQARWERSDPAYARICDHVRQARDRGEEASRRADQAKAEWDARVATQRQASDDAQKTRHALNADQTARRQTTRSSEGSGQMMEALSSMKRSDPARDDSRSASFDTHTTFAIESNDSPVPGIVPASVRVHDHPTAPTRRAARPPAGQGDRLPRPAPSRRRDRTTTPPSPAQHRPDPGDGHRSHYVTITPGPSSPKFHGGRDNLLAELSAGHC